MIFNTNTITRQKDLYYSKILEKQIVLRPLSKDKGLKNQ